MDIASGKAERDERWWVIGGLLLATATLVFAYRALLSFGSGQDLTMGVEYWLFVPNDRAPIVVLALSAWLAYRRWPRLRRLPPSRAPAWLVTLALAGSVAVYFWAIRVRAEDLQAIALIFCIAGLVALRWGLAGLRVLWLPILFLAFCIPVPSPLLVSLLWELRLWTADYTGWLLYLLGVPALVSGDQILRASESFQVIESCSGMRSVETLTMLVILLIDLFSRRGLHAMILVVSAPLVAFALNGVRVLTLTLNPHSEIVAIHSLQGITILLAGLLIVYGFDGLLAKAPFLQRHPKSTTGEPAVRTSEPGRVSLPAFVATALAISLATAAIAVWSPVWSEPRPGRALVAAADQALAGMDYEDLGSSGYFLGRMRFREKLHRSYAATNSTRVEVFAALADLRDRRTSIGSWITAVPGSGWTVKEARQIRIGPDGMVGRQLIVEKGTQRRLVRHQLIGVEGLWRETLRSFLGLDRSDFRRRTGQLALRLSTRVSAGSEAGLEKAEQRLDRMYARLVPPLRATAEVFGAN